MDDLIHDFAKAFCHERSLTSCHFIQNNAKTEEITSVVDVLTQGLLGAHVIGGPQNLSFSGFRQFVA